MDNHNSKLLVTASCNGDIVLWNVNSGQAFCRFNASESPLGLAPKREFSVGEGPILHSGPKKTGCSHRQTLKKCWACSRTAAPLRPALPSRPSSANNPPAMFSVHHRRPASAVSGSRIMWPQAAWSPEESNKSGNILLSHHSAAEIRKDVPTWQEEVSASQVAIEKVLFLNAREREPNTAILLTSCSDGYIYAWAVGTNGGMMGKFQGAHGNARDTVVSAMSTDDKNLVLFTGDSLGYIKIWDIMHYCTPAEEEDPEPEMSDELPPEPNAFRGLIPDYCRFPSKVQSSEETKQEYHGWVTSLIPPDCLNSWKGHLRNVVSIKYIERFRAILTSSHDGAIKLWLLSGRHIGTFGQSVWKLGIQHLTAAEVPEDIRRVGSLHTLRVLNEGRRPHWESTRNIVETLSQQKRQQCLLMDFLHVKSSLAGGAASKMHEMIQKETRIAQYTDDQIEASFQKWEESGKQPRIYHCIQYTDLHPMIHPHVPDILAESQQMQAVAEQRTAKKKFRRWSALTGFVVKPTLRSYMLRKQGLYAKD
ncbi:WD repeat-containing protein on Y chromosome-like isoform X2 [Rhineura floridana]|uniref:WD repeat-containing protein on Y chromosome-like isoform X2 n=1 Tax=Rhineura floridana TaxID=261503 RepID=UPI002AC84798|nr:WD repeat-containing protein on Y chromosome-like isoform X2 [Rhineura floridana]